MTRLQRRRTRHYRRLKTTLMTVPIVLVALVAAFITWAVIAQPSSAKPSVPRTRLLREAEQKQRALTALSESNLGSGIKDTAIMQLQQQVLLLTAALNAKNAPPPSPTTTPRPGPGSSSAQGDCYGGTPLSDTLINNESGGNPNARNPSGAWGCFQIIPGTWRAHCSDLGPHGSASVAAQKECANRIYARQGRGAWSAAG